MVGLDGQVVVLIGSQPDPTAQVLSHWRQGSLGLLRSILGQLDRWDVVTDTESMIGEKLLSVFIDSSSFISSLNTKISIMNQRIIVLCFLIKLILTASAWLLISKEYCCFVYFLCMNSLK